MPSRTRPIAVLRATAVIAALGALGGALGGILVGALFIAYMLVDAPGIVLPRLSQTAEIVAFTSIVGATFGVVLGPALGWTLMRRVPLGRAIGETAFAAALGVGAALVVPVLNVALYLYPVVFAAAAAARLRFAYRPQPGFVEISSGAS